MESHSSMKNNGSGFRKTLMTIFLLMCVCSMTEPRMVIPSAEESNSSAENTVENQHLQKKKPGCCNVLENSQLFALMDRICELCQDIKEQPNMRAKCSFDCFRNQTFKKCLRLFKPIIGGTNSLRRANRILKQMAQSLTESQQ